MKLLAVLLLSAVAVGCGYSKTTTPIMQGTLPIITGLVPPGATHGGPAFTFEVDGSNFHSGAVINFNGAPQTTMVVGATKLTTMIASTAIMNSGTVPVTVTNPAIPGGPYGGGTAAATSTAMTFTVN